MKPIHIQMNSDGRVVALWDHRPSDLEAAGAYAAYLNTGKTAEELAPSIWHSCWIESQPLRERTAIEGKIQKELFEPEATATINVSVPLGPEDLLELASEAVSAADRLNVFIQYVTALSRKLTGTEDQEPGKVVPLYPNEEDD